MPMRIAVAIILAGTALIAIVTGIGLILGTIHDPTAIVLALASMVGSIAVALIAKGPPPPPPGDSA